MCYFENSDSLNNIPPYIGVVSERVKRIPPKWQTPNWFPLIRILQTPVIFQVQENYLSSFTQEAIQAPPHFFFYQYPSYHLQFWWINLLCPPITSRAFQVSHNPQNLCRPENSLIFVIWPVRHKNSLKLFLTKMKPRSVDIKILSLFLANNNQRLVIIKILSNHFCPSDKIQGSDSFNNVFLRTRTPRWPSCHAIFKQSTADLYSVLLFF